MIQDEECIAIPRVEMAYLADTIVDALEQARSGDPGTGYLRLVTGLNRARLADRLGVGWARELVQHYERALRRFTEQQLAGNTWYPWGDA